jgi:uncharacterized protein DUF6719
LTTDEASVAREDLEEIMKTVIGSIAFAGFLAAGGVCHAQTVLKREPMMMNRGTVVLVDDGSCPRGQIKQLTAQAATGAVDSPYGSATKKCIKK